MKAENEELKEKVDVLFKLGRSYINRKENSSPSPPSPPPPQEKKNENDPDLIEVIDDEEVSSENLQAWTKNKLRLFKRVSPPTFLRLMSITNHLT